MASSITPTSNNTDSETCILCTSKHNRTRPSFCQCKHCSIPLCLDCMKEHHDELLQDVAEISHQYNGLQELIQNKQTMIVEETAKSIDDVNRYFETYLQALRDTHQKILANLEVAKQTAQDHVRKVNADLRLLGGEIKGLAKESVVQPVKSKNLSEELKKIEQQLNTYQVIRTDNLMTTQPNFSIQFDSLPAETETRQSTDTEMKEICQPQPPKPVSQISTMSTPYLFSTVPKLSTNSFHENDVKMRCGDNSSDSNDDTDTDDSSIDTSYDVDRMASDGKNILYTTYYDDESDLIAYCLTDSDDDDADDCRDWKQSRIVDMIWWDRIMKFVCATKDGIYTVDYMNRKFKINDVIREKWSLVRLASNNDHLFLRNKSAEENFNGIEVYSTKFEYIKKLDFDKYRIGRSIDESVSFCATSNQIAFLYSRMEGKREVLEVTFGNLEMNQFNSVTLGECSRHVEIRTDGMEQFFVTTGQRQLYIVKSNGTKKAITLQNKGKWIAVLNHRRLAVSNGRSDIEFVTYQT